MGFGNQLSLANFLHQVVEKNQSYSAGQLIVESANQRKNESSLIFKPSLFAQTQMVIDKKPTTNKLAQGDQTDYSNISAGILQQFNIGLQTKLSYNLSHTKIYNASTQFLPVSDFHDGVANIELSQSLWRNFMGRESQAQAAIIASSSQATKHGENYKLKALMAQAESIYWSVSQMRKVLRVQQESFERAIKIRSWNQNRLKNGLGESSDFLQSDANYKAREYELKSAGQELKILQRSLNALRGSDSDKLEEELESVQVDKIKKLTLPLRGEFRDDTKAALELKKISKANAELAMEKNKPTLEVFGNYAVNGRDPKYSDAVSNSFSTTHDTKAIGLRFLAPLDFGTIRDNISGYQKDQSAAELNYRQKLFDQEKEWGDLTMKFEDAKIKLSLIEKIEEAQKLKASNERDRLNKGRTVTFQVLNFEQDYAQSELARIQSETAILNIYAQLKTFSTGDL